MFHAIICCISYDRILIVASREYVNNPQATAETFSADGYFKTGDVMVLDDEGLLTVVDRQKELIKYKGLQGAFPRCRFP